MLPVTMIAMLDRALADYGEDAVLRRSSWVGRVRADVDTGVRAHVRGYLPDELIGGIVQGDRRAILSPTPFGVDDLPEVGNSLIVGGTICAIMAAALIRAGGVVVRIEMQVRG